VVAVASYSDIDFTQRDLEYCWKTSPKQAFMPLQRPHIPRWNEQSRLDSHHRHLNPRPFLSDWAVCCKPRQPAPAGEHHHAGYGSFSQYNEPVRHLWATAYSPRWPNPSSQHPKSTVLVGPGGGEGSSSPLPNAQGFQAKRWPPPALSLRALQVWTAPVSRCPAHHQLGISTFPRDPGMYALIDWDDKRLFHAKENGRDQVAAPPHFPSG
jgi:hypothetical protein